MSIKEKLELRNPYTRKELSKILEEKIGQQGICYCKKTESTLLLLNLDNSDKSGSNFNNFFKGKYFYWESQHKQHIGSSKIQEIVNKEKEVHLFLRKSSTIKGKTQLFKYFGQLEYSDYDRKTSKPVHIIFELLDYDSMKKYLKKHQEIFNNIL